MEALLDMIRRGILRPGDRLPTQRELVSRMGLSQTAVREALRGLASLGVIEIFPSRGAFVRKVSPDLFINPEALFLVLERETLLHALEVRKIIEVEAIGLAAERASADDLAEMERILQQIKEGLNSTEKPLQHSPYFHLAIAKATHNPVIISMVRSFIRLLLRGGEVVAERVPEVKEREYSLHAELYEAILRRDPELARRRMQQHLEVSKQIILQGFSQGFSEFSAPDEF